MSKVIRKVDKQDTPGKPSGGSKKPVIIKKDGGAGKVTNGGATGKAGDKISGGGGTGLGGARKK